MKPQTPLVATVSTGKEVSLWARQSGESWLLLLYGLLTSLRFLTEPPNEKSLRTDLYVMF